jgi:5'(3')-deoxyribonucleotidase/uncharacterized protein with PQ loop repeat
MTVVGSIGTVAALCTTGAFVPQILKIRKQGGRDLSYPMLLVYLTGVLLWLVYGLMFHAPAVIWANVAAAILVSASIAAKAFYSGKTKSDRLRIAVDMDEVIADALSHHLRLYNQATGENLSAEEISKNGLAESIPAKHREVFERIPHEPGFFDDLGVIENSQRALQLLSSEFDIFITSAAMEVPASFDAKYRWLQKHFPFISTSRIVFCGDKEIVNADYLIDDRSRHFARFRGIGILFTAPHNARERARLRANNWEEVLAILTKESRVKDRNTTLELVNAQAESLA